MIIIDNIYLENLEPGMTFQFAPSKESKYLSGCENGRIGMVMEVAPCNMDEIHFRMDGIPVVDISDGSLYLFPRKTRVYPVSGYFQRGFPGISEVAE